MAMVPCVPWMILLNALNFMTCSENSGIPDFPKEALPPAFLRTVCMLSLPGDYAAQPLFHLPEDP